MIMLTTNIRLLISLYTESYRNTCNYISIIRYVGSPVLFGVAAYIIVGNPKCYAVYEYMNFAHYFL